MLREYSSGYSSNCDEAIFGVQKTSLNMFCEYSPCSTNLASDWLKAERSPVDEEEKKKEKGMTVSLITSLASEGTDHFVGLWEAQPCLWDQNDTVVS